MKKMVVTIISCLLILTCFCVNVSAAGETKVEVTNATELQTALTNSSKYSKVTIVLKNSISGNFSTNVDHTEFIIDVGSFSITSSINSSPVLFINESTSDLYIKGIGSIIQSSSSSETIRCLGNLTIESATILNNYTGGSSPVISVENALSTYGGSYKGAIAFDTATITGGTFNATAYDNISSSIVGDYIAKQVTSSPDPVTYTVFHKHESIEYINLLEYLIKKGNSLESGNYYLPCDLSIDNGISIPSFKTINICLNGYDLIQTNKGENSGISVSGSLNIDNCKADESNYIYKKGESGNNVAVFIEDTGSLTISNINFVLSNDTVGIQNDGSTILRNCVFKTFDTNTEIYSAIFNSETLKLVDTTVTGLKTSMGAVMNSSTLIVGGKTKIINNLGPATKKIEGLNIEGQNLFNVGSYVYFAQDDDKPNIDEMKIGIVNLDDFGENVEGRITHSYIQEVEKCFIPDLDEYFVRINTEGDLYLELVAIKKENKKVEPKDTSCEAVIGKDWTWDEKLGVCKLVGYRAVNTATN